MSGSNKPLERLKYVNGQRLDAEDFRLEQEYHMRLRRELNRALYSAGIAAGLEVEIRQNNPHRLVVGPGLALDEDGREIILVGSREVQVMGTPNPVEGQVSGNYLVVEYAEHDTTLVEEGCTVAAGAHGSASARPVWGGMSRVRSDALFRWRDTLPAAGDRQVVLAQVEMDAQCRARRVETLVRNYIGVARPALSRSYALEGEKDINPANPKLIYFHVRGRRPDSVTLHLRAAQFSTLFYSEMPRHAHALNVTEQLNGAVPEHSHTTGGLWTGHAEAHHTHGLQMWTDYLSDDTPGKVELDYRGSSNKTYNNMMAHGRSVDAQITTDQTPHNHYVDVMQTNTVAGVGAHRHDVTVSMGETGASGRVQINNGAQLSFVDNLQILINGRNVTAAILAYLNAQGTAHQWDKFGNGTDAHPLAQAGTGPIQLEFVPGILFKEDENWIELRVAGGGGRIIYNLYVE